MSETDKYLLKAAEMFPVPVDKVTPGQRHLAKSAMFIERYGGDVKVTRVMDAVRIEGLS